MDYIIRASLSHEANEGWIWIEGFPSRTLVSILNSLNGRKIICQTRRLDQNFVELYNDSDGHRHKIQLGHNTIVMSGWYRDALGGIATTDKDNINGKENLEISRCTGVSYWSQLQAASHHPDIVVRLGVRLGAIGIWLGLVSIWLGALSIAQPNGLLLGILGPLVLFLVASFLVYACRAPRILLDRGHD